MTPYYQDDAVTIYHADCREILPQLEPVDLVLTDPPYGIGYANNPIFGKYGNHISQKWDNQRPDINVILFALNLGVSKILWGGNYYADFLPISRCWLSWFKPDAPPSIGDFELAWTNLDKPSQQISHSIAATNGERLGHVTQKPLRVISWAINNVKIAQTILDPFMGSGTTLRAAKDLGRKAIGIEIEEKYCEIAAKRMAQEVLPLAVNT